MLADFLAAAAALAAVCAAVIAARAGASSARRDTELSVTLRRLEARDRGE